MKHIPYLLLVVALFASAVHADDSLLVDRNGDGSVSYLAFGDSITLGRGDDRDTPAGYPTRLAALVGVPAIYSSVAGEQIVSAGVARFPAAVLKAHADIVGILEGANDSEHAVSPVLFSLSLQRMINVAKVSGSTPLLLTLPTPCCEHAAFAPYTEQYSDQVEELSSINELRLADLRRAWRTTCAGAAECELYNIPEGLHPNAKGYTVIAQTVAAALLDIDIFSNDGAEELASALGLPTDAIIVKPDQE